MTSHGVELDVGFSMTGTWCSGRASRRLGRNSATALVRMVRRRMTMRLLMCVFLLTAVSCAGAPKTTSEQMALERQANATIASMTAKDPSLPGVLNTSVAYAV